jgi:hypothetical protein
MATNVPSAAKAQTNIDQTKAQLGQWTTPEACYKYATELYTNEHNWEQALAVLHIGL